MIFCILNIEHTNKIAVYVGWVTCCWYVVVTFLRARCSLYGHCRFSVVGMGSKRCSLNFPMLCCGFYKEIKMTAFVCVCVCVCIVTLLLGLVGANFLFVMWCISGSVCFSAVFDSTFMLRMDSLCYCRMDEKEVFILIFALINCIHFMSVPRQWCRCAMAYSDRERKKISRILDTIELIILCICFK